MSLIIIVLTIIIIFIRKTAFFSSFVASTEGSASLFYSYEACDDSWLGLVNANNPMWEGAEVGYQVYENCPFSGPYDYLPDSKKLYDTVRIFLSR